jgi:hypothetical protein
LVPFSSLSLPSKNVRTEMFIRFSFLFLCTIRNYISHLKRLNVFEYGVLRKMLAPMRVQATEYWRKQHNGKVYTFTLHEIFLV